MGRLFRRELPRASVRAGDSAGRKLQLGGRSVRSDPRRPNGAVGLGDEGYELDDVVRLKLPDQQVVGEDDAVVGVASVDGAGQDGLALGPETRGAGVDAGGADELLRLEHGPVIALDGRVRQ
jgi:hypothetical protein